MLLAVKQSKNLGQDGNDASRICKDIIFSKYMYMNSLQVYNKDK